MGMKTKVNETLNRVSHMIRCYCPGYFPRQKKFKMQDGVEYYYDKKKEFSGD